MLVLITLVIALIQSPSVPLAGRVEAADGRPLRGAVVTLYRADGGLPTSTASDDEGGFTFVTAPGTYWLNVSKAGFLLAHYGSVKPAGRPGTLITIRANTPLNIGAVTLAPAASISGRATNDSLGPATAEVHLLREVSQLPSRRVVWVTSSLTDDRGAFRFGNLPDGNYVVGISPIPRQVKDEVRNGQRVRVASAPTFYPASSSLEDAQAIHLSAGQAIELADIVRRFLRPATLRGTARTSDGTPLPGVSITLTGGPAAAGIPRFSVAPLTVTTKPDATFEFTDLFPGEYQLFGRADLSGRSTWLTESILVSEGEDSHDVEFKNGVSVRAKFDGSPVPSSLTLVSRDVRGIPPVRLRSTLDSTTNEFVLGSVPPGAYTLEIAGPSGLATSALVSGRDILDAGLTVGSEDIRLVVQHTFGEARIEGQVVGAPDVPLHHLFAVILSTNESHWSINSRRVLLVPLAQDGSLISTVVPPGDYVVAVLASVDDSDLADVTFLRAAQRAGMIVKAPAGETSRITLRIQPIK